MRSTQNSGKNSGKRGKPENLKPWKPGESGNPGGRPKKTPVSDAYRKLLEEPYPGDPEGRTYADRIAKSIADEAVKNGSISAAAEIADRIEGKPRQAVEVAGRDGGPIEVTDARQKLFEKLGGMGSVSTENGAKNRGDETQYRRRKVSS